MTAEPIDQIFGNFSPVEGSSNLALLGVSGSGKSFCAKVGALRAVTSGIPVHIVDPEGEYAGIARSSGGITLLPEDEPPPEEASITVFDLHRTRFSEKPAAAIHCLQQVLGLAEQDPRPRVLVVEEFYQLQEDGETRTQLSHMVQQSRRHRLGMALISQDVDRLLQQETGTLGLTPDSMDLMANCSRIALFHQEERNINGLGEALLLDQAQRAWLSTCLRGEALLLNHQREARKIIVQASPQEKETIEKSSQTGG